MAEKFLSWDQPWSEVCSYDFVEGEASWFSGGKLNVSVNCIDRHLPERAEQTAIIWEGDDPADSKHISYAELKDEVCRLANALRARGVKKGDRVCLYLPMIPEAAYAMLACTRIGAVHTIVFGGFSRGAQGPHPVRRVLRDHHRGRGPARRTRGPAQGQCRQGLEECPSRQHLHRGAPHRRRRPMQDGRDVYYDEITGTQSTECEPESMDAEDPLFILYTSGSTGKPKGVLHTTGGYLLQAAMTFKYVFDYRDGEVYWCTADVGWVTGHSYIVYGPLANGATTLMFEGVPTYPDAGTLLGGRRQAQGGDFYTAPTAIRALQGKGDDYV
jgi:acetyl-CoA synthetase